MKHKFLKDAYRLADSFSFIERSPNAGFGVWNDNGSVFQTLAAGCHYEFDAGQATLVVSKMMTSSGEGMKEAFEEFKKFISGPVSPWRAVTHQDDFSFYDDKAVILGPEVLSVIDPDFIKNFVIACRFTAERWDKLLIWKTLVDKGVDPRDAYLMCVHLDIEDGEIIVGGGHHGMGHWPLNLAFCYRKFWYGQVTKSFSTRLNGFFDPDITPSSKEYFPSPRKDTYKVERKQSKFGLFYNINFLDIEAYVKQIREWKERNYSDCQT